ncbi:DUF5606 domain-containing protein [Emticicia sp. BO119]|uniref:DUF5606 family protein n=1 Tax=Emticicia sp. BO119 TaxID=2757768 RepID=UPI0015F0012F|nr:DUF5606 domain-containing protein [Emticicia sp. BO119]MBA4850779.1 DUF5606 domain-containing protein [Emticicia sp. BO119]
MELLRDIAHISGKSGLYKILKPGRGGVIVETLDDKKQREMVSANARVSVLKDISIYTEDQNKSIPLSDIFLKIRELHGETVADDYKNFSNNQFFDFFAQVMPDFDRQKVYPSDIKKIISWYNGLSKYLPEIFSAPAEEEAPEPEVEETKAEA